MRRREIAALRAMLHDPDWDAILHVRGRVENAEMIHNLRRVRREVASLYDRPDTLWTLMTKRAA